MELQEAIESLGLSEKEAKIYLALLGAGASSAYGIAVRSGLKRPTTYVILDDLVRRGVVLLVPRSKKKLYRARDPQFLFERAEKKFKEAKAKLPEIEARAKQESYKPRTLYFEGIEGVKEVLNYHTKELAGGEIKGFYAKTSPEIMKKFDNYKEYNENLKKNNIKLRGIAPKDPSLSSFRKTDKEFRREFKEIPKEEYSSEVAIEIGKDFVRFFDPVNLQGLVIDNPAIAKTMNQIFEMVWKKTD